MVSAADVRVALEAGLWKALVGNGDRAAMRSSCRDARAMADMLHDTAVLPVGSDTLVHVGSIAAYHRRLGAVRALHVRYSAEEDAEAPVLQFMEAYSAALGAALPATHCSIAAGWQVPTPFATVLLQRVVPRVERLDVALGSYGNLEQLLHALEPCARLRALRLHPVHVPWSCKDFLLQHGLLDALCKLTRLHTLSGPWQMDATQLRRLCDALPSLSTLGFRQLHLPNAPCTCVSRQLHTLTASDDAAGATPATPLYAVRCYTVSAIASALPALQRLKGVRLVSRLDTPADELAVRDAVQRFAACAHEWTLHVLPFYSVPTLHMAHNVAEGLPAGCLAPLQHLDLDAVVRVLDIAVLIRFAAAEMATLLGCLVSAAPNLATVKLQVENMGWADIVAPLRQAPHLHTLCLEPVRGGATSEQRAAELEGVVRCLAQPGAEGEGVPCRALRRVLLRDAAPHALDACRRALARDGIAVAVGAY